ncbi:hypothetical protein Ae201684P_019568 [Aphanomyces euteiches]|nr:hypothetical protein Ae201684P_019568 [Aphanomyces euteiches]
MKPASSFHAHDFDWNDLAAKCRAQLEEKDQMVVNVSEDELGTLAQSNWDIFHTKNNVYKPRNYLSKEFPELRLEHSARSRVWIWQRHFPSLGRVSIHVCPRFPHAIDILKANPLYDATRCNAYVCDLVLDDTVGVPENSVDVVLMVFVLSAIPPTSFSHVIEKIYRALKPGGLVCFRDYGLYDLAMMRSTKKVSSTADAYDSLYYRSGDNTLAYYFSTEDLAKLFERFDIIDNSYCTVRLRNRRTQTDMDRVWIHGKFVKR